MKNICREGYENTGTEDEDLVFIWEWSFQNGLKIN